MFCCASANNSLIVHCAHVRVCVCVCLCVFRVGLSEWVCVSYQKSTRQFIEWKLFVTSPSSASTIEIRSAFESVHISIPTCPAYRIRAVVFPAIGIRRKSRRVNISRMHRIALAQIFMSRKNSQIQKNTHTQHHPHVPAGLRACVRVCAWRVWRSHCERPE